MRPLEFAFEVGSAPGAPQRAAPDLAVLAHDLRTALNAVFGGIAAIDVGTVPADVGRQLERIAAAAQCIEGVARSIDGVPASGPGDRIVLFDFLRYIETRWVGEARHQALDFEILTGTDLPAEIMLPHLALARLLGNLVCNAVHYAGTGVVRLTVRRGATGGVRFRLTDDGPGLSADVIAGFSGYAIPAARSQVHGNGNGSGHGNAQAAAHAPGDLRLHEPDLGLGLQIVRRLADELGIEVTLRNRAGGGGCEALIDVPPDLCRDADRPEAGGLARAFVGANGRSGALVGLRVLLAEDNPTNQMVASQMLALLGAEVTVSDDGVQALERFDSGEFDLVVCDIEMPRLTGLDVIRRIRARQDSRSRTPIVALTAYALQEHRERIAAAGADGLIAKPVTSIDELARGLLPHLRAMPPLPASRPDEPPALPAPVPGPHEDPVVDETVYRALASTIGPEMMAELLEKVVIDLGNAQATLAGALDPLDPGAIRTASHILISVAGAIGATRLQACARTLNTAADARDRSGVPDLVRRCIADIDAAAALVTARQTGTEFPPQVDMDDPTPGASSGEPASRIAAARQAASPFGAPEAGTRS